MIKEVTDERGNVVKEIHPNGDVFYYEYDEQNNIVRDHGPNGSIYAYKTKDDVVEMATPRKFHTNKYSDSDKVITKSYWTNNK